MIPIAYNLRSLAVRKTTTLTTAGGLALVVFVFSAVLMLAKGIEQTMGKSGSDDVAILLRDGSDVELSSGFDETNVSVAAALPEVRARTDAQPDAVGEIVAALTMELATARNQISNVGIRGVSEDSFAFRPSVRIVAGRAPRPGTDEAVVGTDVRGRFRGLELGRTFELRKNRPLRVVGVFEDGGSSYESEIWGDLDAVRSAFGRQGLVSSARVRLRSPSAYDAFARGIEQNRQLGLMVRREPDYYEAQSEGMATFMRAMGIVIAVFFSFGAMIGAMITMYAAVSSRSREIGMLRALGFSRFSVMTSFLVEALVLALLGGAMGAGASLLLGFVEFSLMNFASWSEISFSFDPTVTIILGSLAFAGAMGLLGGFFPALRAARTSVLDAMRA